MVRLTLRKPLPSFRTLLSQSLVILYESPCRPTSPDLYRQLSYSWVLVSIRHTSQWSFCHLIYSDSFAEILWRISERLSRLSGKLLPRLSEKTHYLIQIRNFSIWECQQERFLDMTPMWIWYMCSRIISFRSSLSNWNISSTFYIRSVKASKWMEELSGIVWRWTWSTGSRWHLSFRTRTPQNCHCAHNRHFQCPNFSLPLPWPFPGGRCWIARFTWLWRKCGVHFQASWYPSLGNAPLFADSESDPTGSA